MLRTLLRILVSMRGIETRRRIGLLKGGALCRLLHGLVGDLGNQSTKISEQAVRSSRQHLPTSMVHLVVAENATACI